MALHDAGISDFNIMVYSSVLPATAHIASMDEIDLPPFGSELKTILAVSHGQQDEFVSAGVVYAWMYADENFDKKVGGLVCEVSGRYRIEELEARLIRVINDLHQKTYGHYYLGELNFVTEGITIEKRYGTALAGLCFIDFQQREQTALIVDIGQSRRITDKCAGNQTYSNPRQASQYRLGRNNSCGSRPAAGCLQKQSRFHPLKTSARVSD